MYNDFNSGNCIPQLLMGVAVGACGAAEPAALLIVLRPISTCITQILSTNPWGNCGFPN